MSKPRAIIGVDVDGVVADFHAAACQAWNEDNGLTGPARILPEEISGWYWEPVFGPGWRERITRRNLYATMQPIQGARRAVHTLLGLGYRVVYITSCVPGTADAKQRWLLDWGLLTEKNLERDFMASADKSLVRGLDVLFDDSTVNVESFPGHAFLVNHWHNRTTKCKRKRINSLLDAPAVLAKLGY